MKNQNENLTPEELSSVDAMIAYLKAKNQNTIKSDFDAIFGVTNNCYSGPFTDAVFAVTANTGNCISGWIGNVVNAAIDNVAATTGATLKTSESANQAFFDKLADGEKEISLEDLIKIKNGQK